MDEAGSRIAWSHATARVPTAHPEQLAGDVRAALAGSEFECADDVAVLREDRLAGILPIERLLAAAAGDACPRSWTQSLLRSHLVPTRRALRGRWSGAANRVSPSWTERADS